MPQIEPNFGQIEDPRLLPCPFCSSQAAIYMPRSGCYAITCLAFRETDKWDRNKTYCYGQMGGDGLGYGRIDQAVEAWNRRV